MEEQNYFDLLPDEILTDILSYSRPTHNVRSLEKRFLDVSQEVDKNNIKYLNNVYPGWGDNPLPVFKKEQLIIIMLVVKELRYENWNLIARFTISHDVLSWTIAKGANNWKWILKTAARVNSVNICKLALNNYDYWPKISFYAGQYESEFLLNVLKGVDRVDYYELMAGSSKGGKLNMFLKGLEGLAESGSREPIQWRRITIYAGMSGNNDFIQWFIDNWNKQLNNTWSQDFIWDFIAEGAARNNAALFTVALEHLQGNQLIDWLVLASQASRGGNMDVLQIIKGKPVSWNTILYFLAMGGHLNLIKHFLPNERSPDWNSIARGAAIGGYLEILRWVINVLNVSPLWGYRIDYGRVLFAAALHGNKDIILYIMNNVDIIIDWGEIFKIASSRSYIDVLELAVSQKAVICLNTWKRVVKQALDSNDELLLRFAVVSSPLTTSYWIKVRDEFHGYPAYSHLVDKYANLRVILDQKISVIG